MDGVLIMFTFKKKSVASQIKEVILRFNGQVYYALGNDNKYLVSNVDKIVAMKLLKSQGFSINLRHLQK